MITSNPNDITPHIDNPSEQEDEQECQHEFIILSSQEADDGTKFIVAQCRWCKKKVEEEV